MPSSNIRALTALRRLRHVETDGARQTLARALAEEVILAARDSDIAQDLGLARREEGPFDREIFSAWLERMRIERARIGSAIRNASSGTTAARGTLAATRLAETVADEALALAMTAHGSETARRDQTMLEDIARALQIRNRKGK